MNWNKIENVSPPMTPHGQDGSTIRVLVWIKKEYYPHVYTASGDYSEDGFSWYVDGLSHLGRDGWEVTHWALEPEDPEKELDNYGTNHKGDASWRSAINKP